MKHRPILKKYGSRSDVANLSNKDLIDVQISYFCKHKLMVLTFHFDGVVGKTSPDLRVLLVSSTMERKHCNHNIYTFTHHEPFQTF
jgi:hypothetical protein